MTREKRNVRSGRIRFWAGLAGRLALLALVLVGATLAGKWIEESVAERLDPGAKPVRWAMVLAVAAYVVLMALPFVPAVEIGLALLAMFGREIAPVVYGATVLALVLSFVLGRLVPHGAAVRLLDGLHLRRAAALLREVEALAPEERLRFLLRNASSRVAPVLLRHRHLALIVALNLPGNAVAGGGGGIGIAAGASRLFGIADYTLAVAIAAAPVPLAVIMFGR